MDRITFVRGKVINALSGYRFNGVAIPVFDEVVNPDINLPVINGAQTYIILQDQQMVYNAVQTYCNPRFNISLTIKVVTIFGNTGNKKLSEDIGNDILNLLRDDRGNSNISDISEVQLDISRSLNETTSTRVAFSKIFILSFIKNG